MISRNSGRRIGRLEQLRGKGLITAEQEAAGRRLDAEIAKADAADQGARDALDAPEETP